MKIYLAGRFGRREQLQDLAAELRRMGHEVTSRWLDAPFGDSPGQSTAARTEDREKYCLMDLEDLLAADTVVSFTEAPDSLNGKRGGRHVEFGVAMQAGKRLIVVGFLENLFHFHQSVEFFENQWDLVRALERGL